MKAMTSLAYLPSHSLGYLQLGEVRYKLKRERVKTFYKPTEVLTDNAKTFYETHKNMTVMKRNKILMTNSFLRIVLMIRLKMIVVLVKVKMSF